MLTYHDGPGVVECCCGQIIKGNHLCVQIINERRIRVRKCRFKKLTNNTSVVYVKQIANRNYFDKQW